MRILVAPDKFKGSLGAAAVAQQIAEGLREVLPEAEIVQLPIADGGEGTAGVICAARGGEWHTCRVRDPLGEGVAARYCTIADGETAVLEMSEASGLWRVSPERRDVVAASSFGTGEMLLEACHRGVTQIIIGLGGSATNDGGFGMARALGWRFADENGALLSGYATDLLRLARLHRPAQLRLPAITAAVDVQNPLLGPRGATASYAAQKGATPEQMEMLETALSQLADVVARERGNDQRDVAGAGAAGGLGFGLLSFVSATIRLGFEVVAEAIGLEEAVRRADVIITGEGRLDAQTLEGKAPGGVAHLAKRCGKPVHAIVGELEGTPAVRDLFESISVISRDCVTRAEAMANGPRLLRECARDLAATLRA